MFINGLEHQWIPDTCEDPSCKSATCLVHPSQVDLITYTCHDLQFHIIILCEIMNGKKKEKKIVDDHRAES